MCPDVLLREDGLGSRGSVIRDAECISPNNVFHNPMLDAFSRAAVSADSSGSFIGGGELASLKEDVRTHKLTKAKSVRVFRQPTSDSSPYLLLVFL